MVVHKRVALGIRTTPVLMMHAHTVFLCHANNYWYWTSLYEEGTKQGRMREGEMRYTCKGNKRMRGINDGERRKKEGRMKRSKYIYVEYCRCVLSWEVFCSYGKLGKFPRNLLYTNCPIQKALWNSPLQSDSTLLIWMISKNWLTCKIYCVWEFVPFVWECVCFVCSL